MPKIELRVPSDYLKLCFLQSFIKDLESIGYRIDPKFKIIKDKSKIDIQNEEIILDTFKNLRRNYEAENYYGMSFEVNADSFKLSKRKSQKIYQDHKEKKIRESEKFLQRCKENELDKLFISGESINFNEIEPELVILKRKTGSHLSKEEKDENDYNILVFDYLRLLQDIPSEDPPYRKIKALVFDKGQSERKLIGGICLSGSNYYMKARDEYLGWDKIDSIKRKKEIRETGLKQILQLSFCMSVPPYNIGRGCKLLNSLVFSDELQNKYYSRYGDYFMGIVATSALRTHTPIYSDISLKGIKPTYIDDVYKYIGSTKGINVLFVSNDTYSIAKKLVANSNYSFKNKHKRINKKQVILSALRICDIPVNILNIKEIGIYFGTKCDDELNRLKKGNSYSLTNHLSTEQIVDNWKKNYLETLLDDATVTEKIKKATDLDNVMWEDNNNE